VVDTVETVNSRIKLTPENRPSGVKNAVKNSIEWQLEIERFLITSFDSKKPFASKVCSGFFQRINALSKKYRLLSQKALQSFDFA